VDSWPTVGMAGGGSATTSSLPGAAGATDKSTFVCWIAGQAFNNSGGVLRLSFVRSDLVGVAVPAKESGGSLGPPLSYLRYRRAGLFSVSRAFSSHSSTLTGWFSSSVGVTPIGFCHGDYE
jgi:hypothetical protein